MTAYDWSISRQATERFLQCKATERRKLLDHFDGLAANVHNEPTTAFSAPDGTKFSLSSLGNRVITYHVDHAVKQVHIIALE